MIFLKTGKLNKLISIRSSLSVQFFEQKHLNKTKKEKALKRNFKLIQYFRTKIKIK